MDSFSWWMDEEGEREREGERKREKEREREIISATKQSQSQRERGFQVTERNLGTERPVIWSQRYDQGSTKCKVLSIKMILQQLLNKSWLP